MSSSSDGSEGHEATVPPAPARTARPARPALQPRDVVMAVRDLTHRTQAAVLVPTIMQHFSTDLTAADLSSRMEWLWLMRREVATYLRDTALRGHVLHRSSDEILNDLFRAMDVLCADLH